MVFDVYKVNGLMCLPIDHYRPLFYKDAVTAQELYPKYS